MKRFKHFIALMGFAYIVGLTPCMADVSEVISEWKFDGNGQNEINGMPSATLVGNAVFNSSGGVRGGYVHVTTDEDWISIPANLAYNLPISFTIELWFRQFENQSFAQN